MKPFKFHFTPLFALTVLVLTGLALVTSGCGTVQEGTTDDWVSTPAISVTARLEYQKDSLMNENSKLQQLVETTSAENRNLISRNAELEGKLAGASSDASTVPPPTPRPISASGGTYEGALAKFRSRNFQDAIDQFNSLLAGGISSNLADNCEYWIGESYFGMKKYDEAIQHFQAVTRMEGSDKVDDAQFMIGNSYQSNGNKSAAREEYKKLITLYPSSPFVNRAKARISSL